MTAAHEKAEYWAERPWLEVPGMSRGMVERTHAKSCFCGNSRL
ncbi:hypothetical protein BCO37747_00162 [Burkholderia contaminans]|jgi:hypothetical protein|nr:hypothetical protein SK875_C00047 [Burkholderia contaminans]VWB58241.1 hypothetical protein BCO23253_02718 [Burkholderia contaminans]VWC65870.1 hypothetical protein BCO37747_00162 [Burkholderia contaminans]